MNSTQALSDDATQKLVGRLFNATIGALELASVHLGNRLGFYTALADGIAMTSGDLAHHAAAAERYAREWLEQQAVAGFLSVDNPEAEPTSRRYALPAAHRPVFVDEEDLNHLAPIATLAIGVLGPMDALIEAYRTGAGVPYSAYGANTREGIAAINRPMFVNQLSSWFASIAQVDKRLRSQPPARVADIACGSGWSSIAMARAYPDVIVDAIDVDSASIEAALETVRAVGLAGRIRPSVHDASDPELRGRYDLVTIFEALHDMNHPVEALRGARNMLAEGGSVVIGDERVAERFTAPGDEIERFMYGWSVVHCLPVGMLDQDSAGTGTVIRPDIVRALAAEAGFRHVDVLPIENDFWRFYRLIP